MTVGVINDKQQRYNLNEKDLGIIPVYNIQDWWTDGGRTGDNEGHTTRYRPMPDEIHSNYLHVSNDTLDHNERTRLGQRQLRHSLLA